MSHHGSPQALAARFADEVRASLQFKASQWRVVATGKPVQDPESIAADWLATVLMGERSRAAQTLAPWQFLEMAKAHLRTDHY